MLKESTKCEIKCLACFKEVDRQRELKKGICKECIGCVGKQSYTSKATANAASFWMKETFIEMTLSFLTSVVIAINGTWVMIRESGHRNE